MDNFGKPVLQVNWFDLGRLAIDRNSHRSCCPTCTGGVLTMHRHAESLELLAEDLCTLCGQRIVYLDIERVRQERP